MKVLDLRCAQTHDFEGWFASEDDFQRQLQRQLIECPICGGKEIHKRLSAPRLNLGASPSGHKVQAEQDAQAAPVAATTHNLGAEFQRRWLEIARQVVAQTEDVGARFSEEARKMHYGETPDRPIRGQATEQQRQDLHEEGIEVFSLPLPQAAKQVMH